MPEQRLENSSLRSLCSLASALNSCLDLASMGKNYRNSKPKPGGSRG